MPAVAMEPWFASSAAPLSSVLHQHPSSCPPLPAVAAAIGITCSAPNHPIQPTPVLSCQLSPTLHLRHTPPPSRLPGAPIEILFSTFQVASNKRALPFRYPAAALLDVTPHPSRCIRLLPYKPSAARLYPAEFEEKNLARVPSDHSSSAFLRKVFFQGSVCPTSFKYLLYCGSLALISPRSSEPHRPVHLQSLPRTLIRPRAPVL